jgi:hypothetical protein
VIDAPTQEPEIDLQGLEDLVEATTADTGLSTLADAITTPPSSFRRRDDPSLPFYPRGLILDLAMKSAPVKDILQAYNISVEKFKSLTQHPLFRQDLRDMSEKLRNEGYSFKVKAQAQAEAYLNEAWRMVHDPETPANVRQSLIAATVKWAGLENPVSTQSTTSQDLTKLAEDLKNLPADQIELRAMSIILRKSQNAPTDATSSGHVIDA